MRSWFVALGNASLVIVWVVWFVAASKYITSDLVIWASIVALGLHLLVMAALLVLHALNASRSSAGAPQGEVFGCTPQWVNCFGLLPGVT
jgi:hypothetical protein